MWLMDTRGVEATTDRTNGRSTGTRTRRRHPVCGSTAALSVSIKGHFSGGPWLLWLALAARWPASSIFALCCETASTRDRCASAIQRSTALATPNYGYEKRQRELAKKRKAEEKKQKKQQGHGGGDAGNDSPPEAGPEAGSVPGSPPPASA